MKHLQTKSWPASTQDVYLILHLDSTICFFVGNGADSLLNVVLLKLKYANKLESSNLNLMIAMMINCGTLQVDNA